MIPLLCVLLRKGVMDKVDRESEWDIAMHQIRKAIDLKAASKLRWHATEQALLRMAR